MTSKQALERAARLGLSAWTAQASAVGGEAGESVAIKCVGFVDLDVALGEGETWDEAFARATQLIFGAR